MVPWIAVHSLVPKIYSFSRLQAHLTKELDKQLSLKIRGTSNKMKHPESKYVQIFFEFWSS